METLSAPTSTTSALAGGFSHPLNSIQYGGVMIPMDHLDGSMTLSESLVFLSELEALMDAPDETELVLAEFAVLDTEDRLDTEALEFDEFISASWADDTEPGEGFSRGIRGNSVGFFKSSWKKEPCATENMTFEEFQAHGEAVERLVAEANAAGIFDKRIYDACL